MVLFSMINETDLSGGSCFEKHKSRASFFICSDKKDFTNAKTNRDSSEFGVFTTCEGV